MLSRSTKNVLGCGLVIASLLSLSACSTPVKKIEVSSVQVERPELTLPPVDVVRMRSVEWVIITEENYAEVVAAAKASGKPVAFFALTDDGYENLGLNFSDIRALVQQQKAIIASYEDYYSKSNKALDAAEEQLKDKQNSPNTLDKFNIFK